MGHTQKDCYHSISFSYVFILPINIYSYRVTQDPTSLKTLANQISNRSSAYNLRWNIAQVFFMFVLVNGLTQSAAKVYFSKC